MLEIVSVYEDEMQDSMINISAKITKNHWYKRPLQFNRHTVMNKNKKKKKKKSIKKC